MRLVRYVGALVAVVVLIGALVACSGQQSTSGGTTGTAATATIVLQNQAFNPSSSSVRVGATVTIKNEDTVEHHIVVGTTDLGVQQPGASVTWKAPRSGIYILRCLIHPSMSGQITVGRGGKTIGTQPGSGGTSTGGGGGY